MREKKSQQRAKMVSVIVWLVAALIFIAIALYIRDYLAGAKSPSKKVVQQQITVITPPTPPPPPPEPPKPEDEEQPIPEPAPPEPESPPAPADEAPPAGDLGLDADGAGGGDDFGLVGRKGGRDFLAGSGTGGSYTNGLKEKINSILSEDDELKYLKYRAKVRFWVNQQGVVDRFDVDLLDGEPTIRKRIENALSRIHQYGSPPQDLQQPIVWQLTSSFN